MICKHCCAKIKEGATRCDYCKCPVENNKNDSLCKATYIGNKVIAPKKKKNNGKLIIGTIGSVITIIIILAVLIPIVSTYQKITDGLAGEWKCDTNNSISNKSSTYTTDIRFYIDGKIKISKFGDALNNYMKGDYTSEKINEEDKHYTVRINITDYMINGKNQKPNSASLEYDGLIKDNNGESLLTLHDKDTGFTYYCYKK